VGVFWQRGSVDVHTGRTYRVASADEGQSLRCRLQLNNAAGEVIRISVPLKIAPPSKPTVTITSVDVSGHEATLKFIAQRATSTECALAKGPASANFTPCTSPKRYRRLGKGSFAFYVRAVGPGGTSQPAEHSFRIS
jgi:hypothetical protein